MHQYTSLKNLAQAQNGYFKNRLWKMGNCTSKKVQLASLETIRGRNRLLKKSISMSSIAQSCLRWCSIHKCRNQSRKAAESQIASIWKFKLPRVGLKELNGDMRKWLTFEEKLKMCGLKTLKLFDEGEINLFFQASSDNMNKLRVKTLLKS